MSELGKAVLLGIACFAIWLFAMIQAFAGYIDSSDPPARYDHPYHGHLTIYRGHFPSPGPGLKRNGASIARGKSCVVIISEDLYGYEYQQTLRHELGHCNGWPPDHPR